MLCSCFSYPCSCPSLKLLPGSRSLPARVHRVLAPQPEARRYHRHQTVSFQVLQSQLSKTTFFALQRALPRVLYVEPVFLIPSSAQLQYVS